MVAFVCAVAMLCSVHAQTLAHPGWRGNNMAPQAWWKHAVFVRLGSDITFASVTQQLDDVASVHADSLILPDLQPAAGVASAQPFDARFGTEDDLDTLLRETAARRMHLLIAAPAGRFVGAEGEGQLRFWMSRGIAGIDVGQAGASDAPQLAVLRKAMNRYAGERVLMGRVTMAVPRSRAARSPLALQIVAVPAAVPVAPNAPARAVELASLQDAAAIGGAVLILNGALLRDADGREAVRKFLLERGARPAQAATATGSAYSRRRHRRRSHPSYR